MKIIVTLALLVFSMTTSAQDYYAITQTSKDVTYHYPPTVKMNVFDENGFVEQLEGEVSRTFQGEFRIEIQTNWSDHVEVIKSEGGMLHIETIGNVAQTTNDLVVYGGKTYTKEALDAKMAAKPYAISNEIVPSEKKANHYNLEVVFSNGLVFSYQEGKVTALQSGKELNVEHHYLVNTPEGLLKLYFNPKIAEFWYVFDIL